MTVRSPTEEKAPTLTLFRSPRSTAPYHTEVCIAREGSMGEQGAAVVDAMLQHAAVPCQLLRAFMRRQEERQKPTVKQADEQWAAAAQ